MKEKKKKNKDIVKDMSMDEITEMLFYATEIKLQIMASKIPSNHLIMALGALIKKHDLTIYLPSYEKDKGLVIRKSLEMTNYISKLYFHHKMTSPNHIVPVKSSDHKNTK